MDERSEPTVRNHGYRCAIRTTARLRAVSKVLEELQPDGAVARTASAEAV